MSVCASSGRENMSRIETTLPADAVLSALNLMGRYLLYTSEEHGMGHSDPAESTAVRKAIEHNDIVQALRRRRAAVINEIRTRG